VGDQLQTDSFKQIGGAADRQGAREHCRQACNAPGQPRRMQALQSLIAHLGQPAPAPPSKPAWGPGGRKWGYRCAGEEWGGRLGAKLGKAIGESRPGPFGTK